MPEQPARHGGRLHDHAPRQEDVGRAGDGAGDAAEGGDHEQRRDQGASEPAWETIHQSPGPPDIWQLHYAEENDKKHNAPAAFIANKGANCQGLLDQADGADRRQLHDSERAHPEGKGLPLDRGARTPRAASSLDSTR